MKIYDKLVSKVPTFLQPLLPEPKVMAAGATSLVIWGAMKGLEAKGYKVPRKNVQDVITKVATGAAAAATGVAYLKSNKTTKGVLIVGQPDETTN